MSVEDLAVVSRRYGSDPDYVLAGGGNTSYKDGSSLYIKASGFPLGTIQPDGFVRMDREKLGKIWSAEYPDASAEREPKALADLMDARCPGEEAKRPSVETLVHESLDEAYVVHTHPALVNGLTCSMGGAERMTELFGEDALWVPFVEPGYILARTVRRMRSAHIASYGSVPRAIFLQNHGVFISADTIGEIDDSYAYVFNILTQATGKEPELPEAFGSDEGRPNIEDAISQALSTDVSIAFLANPALLAAIQTAESFEPYSSAYTPDHIVYAGHRPVFISAPDDGDVMTPVTKHIAEFQSEAKRDPKIIAVSGVGIFGVGDSTKSAERAVTLFLDAVKIGVYAQSHGGHHFLPDEMIRFIMNWEVESYRSSIGKNT